jgi:hypothetical protein
MPQKIEEENHHEDGVCKKLLDSMGHEVINLRHLPSLPPTHSARKGLGSSTFEAKSFPHSDQSQPPHTAPEGWHTYFHLATH